MPSTGAERILRGLSPPRFVKCKDNKGEVEAQDKFACMHALTYLSSSTSLRRLFLPPLSILTATLDELLYCRTYRGDGVRDHAHAASGPFDPRRCGCMLCG